MKEMKLLLLPILPGALLSHYRSDLRLDVLLDQTERSNWAQTVTTQDECSLPGILGISGHQGAGAPHFTLIRISRHHYCVGADLPHDSCQVK